MRKITFILLALVSGSVFAQESATANAAAEIVSPIAIESDTDLNFGTINGTTTGGDVTVAFNGDRLFTNSDMEVSSAATVSAATFSITAADGYVYSIDIPDSQLTGAGTPMDVVFEHNRNNSTRRTGDGNAQELRVGGTLTVNDEQVAGAYSGNVVVTVAYE